MFNNLAPSDSVTLLDRIAPLSQGVGTVTTGWIKASDFHWFLAKVQVGVMGASGTVDAKLQQATDGAGTGAKDVTGSSITQLVKATDDGKFSLINLDPNKLDVNGGFDHIRLSIGVGTAASLLSAEVYGLQPRYGIAAQNAALKQALVV
jgi:hypothetical protein